MVEALRQNARDAIDPLFVHYPLDFEKGQLSVCGTRPKSSTLTSPVITLGDARN